MSRKRRQWGEASEVCLELSWGATVTLSFKGNLFDLVEGERRLISDLSTVVQDYKDALAKSASLNENPPVLAKEAQHGGVNMR
jgi:hypothetical protein